MPGTDDPHELAELRAAAQPGWIPTQNYESRRGARVRLVVLHTTEGATNAVGLGRYFQAATSNQVSYHAGWDELGQVAQYVAYDQAAWAILAGNRISDNGAFCCSAVALKWTRADWLNHPVMLESAAQWVAERCTARGVPIRRLSIAETAAAVADPNHPGGVVMHRDYTQATGDGSHTDCGDNLPWDLILARAQQIAAPTRSRRREDNVMELPATKDRVDKQLPTDVVGGWCGQANLLLTANTDGNTNTAQVYGILAVISRGDATPPVVTPLLDTKTGQTFVQWWPRLFSLPAGTTSVIINYQAPSGMVAHVEYER